MCVSDSAAASVARVPSLGECATLSRMEIPVGLRVLLFWWAETENARACTSFTRCICYIDPRRGVLHAVNCSTRLNQSVMRVRKV